MALVPVTRATILTQDGRAERAVLYLIKNVDTADTYDCANEFNEVKAATFIAAGDLATVGTVAAAGTVLTFTNATMADDNIYLLVVGQAS